MGHMVASHMENQLSCHCVTIPPIFDRLANIMVYIKILEVHWDDICNMFVRAQWPFNKIYFRDKIQRTLRNRRKGMTWGISGARSKAYGHFILCNFPPWHGHSKTSWITIRFHLGAIFYCHTGYSEKDSQLLNKYVFVKGRKSRTVSSIRMFLELPCFLHNGYNGSVMQFLLPITIPFSLPLQWQQDLSPYMPSYIMSMSNICHSQYTVLITNVPPISKG